MPRRQRWSAALAFTLALLGLTAPAGANDGAFLGSGAEVYPIENDAIAMVEEDLEIRQTGPAVGSYVDGWSVKVTYRFRNTSDEATKVQMGFPEHCERSPARDPDDARCHPTIRGFTATVDGKALKTRVRKRQAVGDDPLEGTDFGRVHTFEVAFDAGQERKIVHTYALSASIGVEFSELYYILRTGSLWAGPISRLHIDVHTLDMFEEVTLLDGTIPKPTTTVVDGETRLSWRLTDVEPGWDLGIRFARPVSGMAREKALDAFCSYPDGMLRKVGPDVLREWRNTVYAAYGYAFEDQALATHFAREPWYRVRPDYSARWVRPDHQACVRRIKAAERARGK